MSSNSKEGFKVKSNADKKKQRMKKKQNGKEHRGSNLAVNVVNWFSSGLTFVHGAFCFKMHKINENGFCYKMLCLQIHTKNASKFL